MQTIVAGFCAMGLCGVVRARKRLQGLKAQTSRRTPCPISLGIGLGISPPSHDWPDVVRREMEVAVEAALVAGQAMLEAHTGSIGGAGRGAQLGVSWKDAVDPVTEVDEANERLIVAALSAAFPDHMIIGEEASAHSDCLPDLPADGRATWIVDPVDGTQNLVHGLPISAVRFVHSVVSTTSSLSVNF